jgi:hypothetical protein
MRARNVGQPRHAARYLQLRVEAVGDAHVREADLPQEVELDFFRQRERLGDLEESLDHVCSSIPLPQQGHHCLECLDSLASQHPDALQDLMMLMTMIMITISV